MTNIRELAIGLETAIETAGAPQISSLWEELRARLEEREQIMLTQTRRMSVLASLGQNVSELIHEMRQPLLGIQTWSQLLQEQSKNPPFVADNARKIEQQAKRLTYMLDRHRALFCSEEPEAELTCDLNQAVEAAIDLLSPRIHKARARATKELAPDALLVPVGSVELQQVLINLVGNALEALPAADGLIEIATASQGGQIEATVRDNGPGVALDTRPRLFDPFFTTKPDGAGLGLHISREILQNAGGTLTLLESSEGACFRIRLPRITT